MSEAAFAGACYGYRVRSHTPLRFTRDGGGDTLDVEPYLVPPNRAEQGRPLLEWSPPAFPFAARLQERGDQYDLWIGGAGWFGIDPHRRRIRIPESPDVVRREERLWGLPVLLCFLERGDIPLHAAAVEIGGAAVLLAAPGRFGKTTLAAAFAAAGHRVLTEDLACVRLEDGRASVVPGPAVLRLRHDVADRLPIPGSVVVASDDDRLHVTFDERGTCRPVPLRAVVLLRGEADEPTLRPVPPEQTLADLWSLSFHLPTGRDRGRCFAGLVDLASTVPLWNLRRRLQIAALNGTVEAIIAGCLDG